MPARASILGDTGPNAPSTWEFGNDPDRTHVFFALYGRTAEARERLLASLRAELAAGRRGGGGDASARCADARQSSRAFRLHGRHRSARDRRQRQRGISGRRHADRRRDRRGGSGGAWAPLKAGEFVLGWPGETGFSAAGAAAGRAREERQLSRLSQAASGRRGVSRVPARTVAAAVGSRCGRARDRAARVEAGGTLAERLSGDARAARRQSGDGDRLGAQQRLPLRGRSARRGLSARLAHPPHESARRARRSRRHARAHASHRAARTAVRVVARRQRDSR